MDRIIRGISKNKSIRFFAVDATSTVKKAVKLHHLSITNAVVLGRMLSAGLMMAAELKSEKNSLTLKIDSDGLIGGAMVTAKRDGFIKGYIKHPQVELPINDVTKTIDVQAAIGSGRLSIIKDLGLKQPYIGQIELKYSTIAEDLTYYFAKSEQTPSSVGLGVLIMPDGTVKQAGGFIIQLMPDADEEVITILENNLKKFPNLTDVMDMGHSIEDIIEKFLLKHLSPHIKHVQPAAYKCDCSPKRFESGIRLLSKDELEDAVNKNETLKIKCHFCGKVYDFAPDQIKKMILEKS